MINYQIYTYIIYIKNIYIIYIYIKYIIYNIDIYIYTYICKEALLSMYFININITGNSFHTIRNFDS